MIKRTNRGHDKKVIEHLQKESPEVLGAKVDFESIVTDILRPKSKSKSAKKNSRDAGE